MTQKILVTGAAGYIGGSVLADFVSRTSGLIKIENIIATVRTKEQAQVLSKLGIKVIQVDLSNTESVQEAIIHHQIDIVVHTASSMVPGLASNLINALGQRRKVGGEKTYFIHSSVTTMFAAEGGWPHGEITDVDPILEKDKQIEAGNPVRDTNILVTELAKAQEVTSFIIPLPVVYGKGTGEWRKLSVFIPAIIRASIAHGEVYKFDVDARQALVHVSDAAALYGLLVQKILRNEVVPSGEQGYYFAFAHRAGWWDIMQRLADKLHTRGLVAEPKVQIWPSDEMAAEYLRFPVQYVRMMGTTSGQFVAVNGYRLGWQPKWDEDKFLDGLDNEIQAVQELDTVKATVFESLGVNV